jgi:hypothetical protein
MSGHTLTLEEEAKISAIRIFSGISNELQQVEIEFERQARSNVQGDRLSWRVSSRLRWLNACDRRLRFFQTTPLGVMGHGTIQFEWPR